jgi:hypothetical protein
MHIRRGKRDVPQPGDAKLAEVAVLRLDMTRAGHRRARRVVVMAAEQVVRVTF